MGDLNQEYHGLSNGASLHRATPDRTLTEPVRTRWTPKPEQILILESIFNSGMVNPPKDETVRIRKLLERFGSVGDANVFYWFQNRRSRSRRRQRQLMQATLMAAAAAAAAAAASDHPGAAAGVDALYQPTSISTTSSSSASMSGASIFSNGSANFSHNSNTSSGGGAGLIFPCSSFSNPAPKFMVVDDGGDDLFSISRRMGLMDSTQTTPPPSMCSSQDHVSQLHFLPTGTVTVFIDGIPWEVPMGPVDLRAVFGLNAVMLVHSSGEILPVNEHGILMQSLQMGESYFLVSRSP